MYCQMTFWMIILQHNGSHPYRVEEDGRREEMEEDKRSRGGRGAGVEEEDKLSYALIDGLLMKRTLNPTHRKQGNQIPLCARVALSLH